MTIKVVIPLYFLNLTQDLNAIVKEEDLSKSKAHYNKILQTAESIRAQHSRQEKSQLWLELKTAYRMDLKVKLVIMH